MKAIEMKVGTNTYCLAEDGNVYNITKWKEGDPRPKPLKWIKADKNCNRGQYKVYLCNGKGKGEKFSTYDAIRYWYVVYGEDLNFESIEAYPGWYTGNRKLNEELRLKYLEANTDGK